MIYYPTPPKGQTTKTNSTPVVLATEQEAILSSITNKLPTSLGATTSVNSLSTSLPTDTHTSTYKEWRVTAL